MENALITGATKGMGRAIAIAFAKQGVNIAVCSRNQEDLSSFKKELLQKLMNRHVKKGGRRYYPIPAMRKHSNLPA